MINRRIFALSILSVIFVAGCSEAITESEGTAEGAAVCGDGKLAATEVCDGALFAEGKNVCAAGMVGTPVCVNCQIMGCNAATPVCGDGQLGGTEECDKSVFAVGKNVCPAGTTGTPSCSSTCTIEGCTVAASCGNGQVDSGEECDGTAFAAGKNVCPTGYAGSPVCVNCAVQGCVYVKPDSCGNGQLDAGEKCDGSAFADGARVCPEGSTGAESLITCTSDCQVDVTSCVSVSQNCGNGQLDAGEDCDGTAFADGKKTCDKATCRADCIVEDSLCASTCGNGQLDAGEDCDGTAFADGKKTCDAAVCNNCVVDTSACSQNTCGNGQLDAGEDCDGTVFASGKKQCDSAVCSQCVVDNTKCVPDTCNDGKLDDGEDCDGDIIRAGKDVCPTGTTGNAALITCDSSCHVVTEVACKSDSGDPCAAKGFAQCAIAEKNQSKCVDEHTAAKCVNGCWETTVCESPKTCMESLKACGVVDHSVTKCSNNQLMICEDDVCEVMQDCTYDVKYCDIAQESCVEKPVSCNGTKLTIGDFTVDCAASGMTCDKTKGCVTKESEGCVDNVYRVVGEKGDVIEENCTSQGKVCDNAKGCTANGKGFTCDGSTIKITGTSYTYDCRKNASSSDSAVVNKLGCSAENACTDAYCSGNKLQMCYQKSGCEEVLDCTVNSALSCSEKLMDCTCSSEKSFCFKEGGKTKWAVCDSAGMDSEVCPTDECDDTTGCVKGATNCGDGMSKDTGDGEQCDWQDYDGVRNYMSVDYKKPTCNYYDSSKLYKSGTPTCENKKGVCKISVEKCVEATDADFTSVKKWTFTKESDVTGSSKNGITIHHGSANDGFKTSAFVSNDNAWQIGSWVSGSNPDFEYYMWFKAGDVKKNAIQVSFEVKRASTGPKNIMLQYFDGSKALSKSDAFTVTESYQKASFVVQPGKVVTDFSFKLTGYNGGAGTMSIRNVEVKSLDSTANNDNWMY